MATCHRCGQEIRWARVGDERIALNARPQLRPPGHDLKLYRLVADDAERAEPMSGGRFDMQGYAAHRETCPGVKA